MQKLFGAALLVLCGAAHASEEKKPWKGEAVGEHNAWTGAARENVRGIHQTLDETSKGNAKMDATLDERQEQVRKLQSEAQKLREQLNQSSQRVTSQEAR